MADQPTILLNKQENWGRISNKGVKRGMSFYTILLVAIALGTDAFSLAVCMGLNRGGKKQLYLFPLIVAAFHVLMPLVGLWLGELLGKTMGKMASAIGAVVLILIGLQMFREAWVKRKKTSSRHGIRPFKETKVFIGLWAIILAAGSVSLDALTAGLGLGVMHANLTLTVITMGVVAGLMTFLGIVFGRKLGNWLGEKAQLFGGAVLIIIGVMMFF